MENNLIKEDVSIQVDSINIEGTLVIPKGTKGIVIFVHGSGSSRHSPRNIFVASELQKNNLATLLFDLLTKEEDNIYENRFNINLLSKRLHAITRWIKNNEETKHLNSGYFGASTGAAAALQAAIKEELMISAIVSRGGRPDLAKDFLTRVKSPTLLIVGGNDDVVIKLNKEAFDLINTKKELKIIPGASHLFEEPGKLEEVSKLAVEWFKKYLDG